MQWNKDPPIQQVNYKNIGTYRPRYFNGYNFSNPSTTSGITTQTNLSMPDLVTIPEDSIISIENGELTEQVIDASDVQNPSLGFTVTLTQSTDPHLTRIKSASMDELRDDVTSRCTINPLHNSDDSNLHISSTSKDELLSNDNKILPTANTLHVSDEPPHRQMNGFVHHTLTNDDQSSSSSNESDHSDCAVNNTKNLSAKFNDTKDTSILALAAVI